jgi:hypothetical protein
LSLQVDGVVGTGFGSVLAEFNDAVRRFFMVPKNEFERERGFPLPLDLFMRTLSEREDAIGGESAKG